MASSGFLHLVHNFCIGFSSNQLQRFLQPPISSVPFGSSSGVPLIPELTSSRDPQKFKIKHLLQASAEGVPSELTEDSKFVPLNAEEPRYGPPALLLCGFGMEETTKIQEFLRELEGEFLKVIHCTEEMISGSLGEAMNTQQNSLEEVKIAKSLPRICFLSGLSGEEMLMFIDAFPEAGLEPAVFAALVPNSANKPLKEVIEEIMGDHEMMRAKEAGLK